jgi:hypothetical protein
MKTIQVTVSDFCKIHGMKSQVEAHSVMNMLKNKGHAVEVGKLKRADGRGKPSTIYQIPQTVTMELFSDKDASRVVVSESEEVTA